MSDATQHAPSLETQLRRIEELVAQIERCGDGDAEEAAREMVRTLLDLHAAGLSRILQWLTQGGAAGRAVLDGLCRDEVVSPLLLLHGLHPVALEERLRRGLAKLRPRLHAQAAEVELLAVNESVARLRLRVDAECDTAARASLKTTIEEALFDAAPDAELIIEEVEAEATVGQVANLP
jgi:hypothetical protein